MIGLKKDSGFTLVELLVVLAIIGTLAFLAMPTYGRLLDSLKLDGNARRIASALRLYHQRAITDHQQRAIEFYTSDDTYAIEGWKAVRDSYWQIDEGIEVLDNLEVAFGPFGNATFVPVGQNSVRIQNAEGTRTIEVKATTGHVRITSP